MTVRPLGVPEHREKEGRERGEEGENRKETPFQFCKLLSQKQNRMSQRRINQKKKINF